MSVRRLPSRLLVGLTSAALVGGAIGSFAFLNSAAAADAAPTAGCSDFVDAKGDAHPVQASIPNDADLDITGLVLGADAKSLRAVVRTDALSTSPDTAPGDTWDVYFTYGGKDLSLQATRFDPDQLGAGDDAAFDVDDTAGLGFFIPRVTLLIGGVYAPSDISVAYDTKASTVSFKVSRADVGKAAGAAFADGAKLTKVYARNATAFPLAGGFYVDSTTATNNAVTTDKDTWTVGAGKCFGAAPAPAPTGTGTPAPTPSGSASPSPTATGSPSPTPTGGPVALFSVPRKACVQYTDPSGDADPTGPLKGAPGISAQAQEPSLDVTQVNLRSPQGALDVFVKVVKSDDATNSPIFTGRKYDVAFTVGGKAIALSATGKGPATATVGGTANTAIKATVAVDDKNSLVIFTVPLDGLATAVGAPVAAGTAITDVKITTTATGQSSQKADDAAGTKPEEKTYAYGDNKCFLPPAGKLSLDTDPSGQYSDTTSLFATLTDADDAPVVGATVSALLTGGKAVSAVTDGDGVAEITVPIAVPAGAKTLTASFAGTDVVGAVTATAPFTVKAEKATLKVVATRGGASATLLDDDKHPIVGQVVTFTVGSKKYTVKTNAKGVAVLTKIAKGTAIKVAYLGAKGFYTATPTYTVKAL